MDLRREEEFEDEQILALRAELRINRLNGSGINKIAESTSATPDNTKKEQCRCSNPQSLVFA
jgi:hypothetical protein